MTAILMSQKGRIIVLPIDAQTIQPSTTVRWKNRCKIIALERWIVWKVYAGVHMCVRARMTITITYTIQLSIILNKQLNNIRKHLLEIVHFIPSTIHNYPGRVI